MDPAIVDHIVDEFRRGDADYAANVLEPTYPRGMDVQVFPAAVLAEVATLTDDPGRPRARLARTSTSTPSATGCAASSPTSPPTTG